ncbi:MAG: GGDEF domain-containing protein [Oscillospiraceae bacterium]
MIKVLYFVAYAVYHFFTVSYYQKVMMLKISDKKVYLTTFLVNLFNLYIFVNFLNNDVYIILSAFIFSSINLYIIYKDINMQTLMISFYSYVNIYSIMLILRGIISLYLGVEYRDAAINAEINGFVFIVSVVIFSVLTFVLDKIIYKDYFKTLNSDKSSVKFILTLLFFMMCFHLYNVINIYLDESYELMTFYQIKIGIVSLLGLFIVFYYAYTKAQFDLFKFKSFQIEEEINKQKQEEKELMDLAVYDSMTGFFKREYGLTYLKDTIHENKDCVVIFIDLDGLKKINDKLGHDIGDRYICSVVDILKKHFPDCIISRFGGDEFFIISTKSTFNQIECKLGQCAYQVESTSDKVGYAMSISYGYHEIDKNNTLNYKQIIDIVDDKMYQFKRDRKKNR